MLATSLASWIVAPLAAFLPGTGEESVKVTTLMLEGDVLPGVGNPDFFNHVQVNDRGDWSVIARMSDPPNHQAVVVNGEVLYEIGDDLGGHSIATLYEHQLANSGDLVIDPAVGPAPASQSLFFNDVPLYIEGDPVSPALELWPGAVHRWFNGNKWHEKKEIASSMHFELPNGELRQAIVRVRLGEEANIVSESIAMPQGHVLPNGLRVLGINEHQINDAGQALLKVRTNGPFDHTAVYLDDELLAELYGEALTPGSTWGGIGLSLALNDVGDWALMAWEDGPGNIGRVVKNAQAYASEGDVLPEAGTVLSVNGHVLHMDAAGEILWGANLVGGSAWCRGAQVLVKENTSSPVGIPFENLLQTGQYIDMSDNGRFVVFAAVLEDGTIGAFLISPAGDVQPMSECAGNAGSLQWTGGVPEGGETLQFEMDGAASDSGLAFLHASLNPVAGWPDCGIALPGIGELLIDIASPSFVTSLSQAWSGSPVTFEVSLPAAAEAIGAHVYLQGHFLDPSLAPHPNRLTGALEVVIGDGIH